MNESVKDLVYLFEMFNRITDSEIREAIIILLYKYATKLFTNEAGIISPTIGMVEELSKNNIRVRINRKTDGDDITPPYIVYIMTYEDGVHEDISIFLNLGGNPL
ncbi:MAG: hypothetical protein IJ193_00215 [Bacilli bacterium]|nr:hypothetical protein [Bacilli bacterium]